MLIIGSINELLIVIAINETWLCSKRNKGTVFLDMTYYDISKGGNKKVSVHWNATKRGKISIVQVYFLRV